MNDWQANKLDENELYCITKKHDYKVVLAGGQWHAEL